MSVYLPNKNTSQIEKERAQKVPETPEEKAERDEVLRKRKAILRREQQNRKLALGRRIATLMRDGKQSHLWNVIRDSMIIKPVQAAEGELSSSTVVFIEHFNKTQKIMCLRERKRNWK